MSQYPNLIVTAASAEFGPSLLALLGSLTLNWPAHPPVVVYDIGLDERTCSILDQHSVAIKGVPSFAPHWRDHFTWKIWCLNDAEATNLIWMDAGLVVLDALDEIVSAVDRLGYFFTTNRESLDWEASTNACLGCEVSTEFRNGKLSLAATLMGFKKTGVFERILTEALFVALEEKNIAATEVTHRHDQALLSLLTYKHQASVLVADPKIYLCSLSPCESVGQKIWVHRRRLKQFDAEYLATHISKSGPPFRPSPPYSFERAQGLAHLYRVYWYYGQGKDEEAKQHLELAFRVDPSLRHDTALLANKLNAYRNKLGSFSSSSEREDFVSWAGRQLLSINGLSFSVRLGVALTRIR